MSSIFDKWNKAVDTDALMKDVREVEQNGGSFEYVEVPHGEYEVKIEKMELKASKKGDPMFSCWFKILTGEFKDKLIFMNQVITQGFQIHIVNEFLRSLETDINVEFDGDYNDYNDLIMDIMEEIDGNCEFALAYQENNKGYNTFEILEIFDV